MNVEDEEWVQHALMDFERKRCISKVLSLDCENAIPKGNNYSSDMFRLQLKTVLYSGEIVNKSFIYKALPATETRRKLMREANVYRKEMKLYTEILPQMEKIRQEKKGGVEPLAPVCYGVRQGCTGYLLEDLNEIGYKMADRRKGLDYQHGVVAVKALAEYHALSLVLIERGDFIVDDWKGNYCVEHPGALDPMILSTIEEIERIIKKEWHGEWLIYAEKLKEFSKTVMTKFVDEQRFNENNFNVLTHSDYWTTNMMFRYNDEGIPQRNRLIDFQVCHYNNAGLDLQYFFNTSLTAEALVRVDELLRLYYDTLKSCLSLYGIPEKTPEFEAFLESYDRAKVYGLTVALSFKPLMMQPPEAVPQDLEEWTKNQFQFEGEIKPKPTPPKIDLENLRSVFEIILKNASNAGLL